MAAEVSSLVRILNGYIEEQQQQMKKSEEMKKCENSKPLLTRDLLGGCSSSILGSKELDLDLQVPNGWEKRLDLKSGNVYLQRCNSPISSSSSSEQNHQKNNQEQEQKQSGTIQDLNFPPPSVKNNNLMEESCSLDLKLVPSYDFQISSSVCTLDKVKSALERAEKESSIITKKRLFSSSSSVVVAGGNRSSSSSSSSSSPSPSLIKEEDEFEEEEEKKSCSSSTNSSTSSSGLLFAAGCPGCLFYVLISKSNPKCPRCDSIVPSPVVKKPRIDLNLLSF